MRKTLLSIVFIGVVFVSFSQGTNIPLGSKAYTYMERLDIKYSRILPITNTGEKPYRRSKAARMAETLLLSNLRLSPVQRAQIQFLADDNAEWLDSIESTTRRPLWKLYREPASFLHVSSKNKDLFNLRINPMIEFHTGVESYQSRFLFTRTAGLEVRGNIKRVFSFYFNVTGNSARLPKYIIYEGQRIGNINYPFLAGQAYWKDYSSKLFQFDDGVDYFDARGYINVNVLKYLNISLGRDKNFIGNGQRSLFLSDFSAPYLFLKFNVNIWRFNYQSIIAELAGQHRRGVDALLPKKYMAVHRLSVQATHWLELGIYESVILTRSNQFELQYLNPIIFYRSVEHALGSPDNVMIGGDFKMNFINHCSVYGQFLLDELNVGHFFKSDGWWANKWGAQLGIKYIDILPNLDGQMEFNMVRPYTYTHNEDDNFTNYNQPLAHPLGANFYEILFNLRYQPIPSLSFTGKFISARTGDDTLVDGRMFSNFGGDILLSNGGGALVNSQTGNKLGQGAKGTLSIFQLVASYQPWHNIFIDAEIMYRNRTSARTQIPTNNRNLTGSSFMFTIGARVNVPYKSYYF